MREQDSKQTVAPTPRHDKGVVDEHNLKGGDPIEQAATTTDGSGQPQIVTPPPPPNG